MKRIKVETTDRIYYAKPLTLGQLEEFEGLLNEIAEESTALQTENINKVPVALLKKQAQIVLSALQRHDATVTDMSTFTMSEISGAFVSVLNGSGLVEVEPGNAVPGA